MRKLPVRSYFRIVDYLSELLRSLPTQGGWEGHTLHCQMPEGFEPGCMQHRH